MFGISIGCPCIHQGEGARPCTLSLWHLPRLPVPLLLPLRGSMGRTGVSSPAAAESRGRGLGGVSPLGGLRSQRETARSLGSGGPGADHCCTTDLRSVVLLQTPARDPRRPVPGSPRCCSAWGERREAEVPYTARRQSLEGCFSRQLMCLPPRLMASLSSEEGIRGWSGCWSE